MTPCCLMTLLRDSRMCLSTAHTLQPGSHAHGSGRVLVRSLLPQLLQDDAHPDVTCALTAFTVCTAVLLGLRT